MAGSREGVFEEYRQFGSGHATTWRLRLYHDDKVRA